MKILRTNLSPGMTVLAVLFVVMFAFILIPLVIIFKCVQIVYRTFFGGPSSGAFPHDGARRRSRFYGSPFERDRRTGADDGSASGDDDAIECEVISARTIDENGREIR